MMAAALTLLRLGVADRDLYLFDTFKGMPAPGELDADLDGISAHQHMQVEDKSSSFVWAIASLEDVTQNLFSTAYPRDLLHFVEGRVEETVPDFAPEQIAILRLDTDWYESTLHELNHLYPRLSPGGIIILDDYGHWQGAKRAVDEFLSRQPTPLFLHWIDYTGRLIVKPYTNS